MSENIISADFRPKVFRAIIQDVRDMGVMDVRQAMIQFGYHPSFVAAITKKVLRNLRGGK